MSLCHQLIVNKKGKKKVAIPRKATIVISPVRPPGSPIKSIFGVPPESSHRIPTSVYDGVGIQTDFEPLSPIASIRSL